MILDASSIKPGDLPDNIDLCIVGSGAVGIAMAQRLRDWAKTNKKNIVVLESSVRPERIGTTWSEHRWRDHYEVIRELDAPSPPDQGNEPFWYRARHNFFTDSRTRCYGGSTNCWGGFIRPLDEYDFTNWPLKRSDLDGGKGKNFYQEALSLVGLSQDSFRHFDLNVAEDLAYWQDRTGVTGQIRIDELNRQTLQSKGLKTVVIQQQTDTKKIDFNEQFNWIFEGTTNLTLLKNATALTARWAYASGLGFYVSGLQCGAFVPGDKVRFEVKAARYVLAMGGLEIPRFLLISERINELKPDFLKYVGKYYMNHPKYLNLAYSVFSQGGIISPLQQRFYAGLVPLGNSTAGVQAFVVPEKDSISKNLTGNFRTALVWDDVPYTRQARIEINFEQVPNESSRLELDLRSLDYFQQPRLKLDWRFTPLDANTVNFALIRIREVLSALGPLEGWKSNVEWSFDANAPYPPVIQEGEPYTGDHHMGTCRMNSRDGAKDGVVNSNCKAIGFSNLWICSTGVYPTGGWANATLTLLALALRLADHLIVAKPTLQGRIDENG
jgi:choline dehydrogenase-like flavoprotein